jgi:Ca-activated chloride channel family protein
MGHCMSFIWPHLLWLLLLLPLLVLLYLWLLRRKRADHGAPGQRAVAKLAWARARAGAAMCRRC